MKDYSEGQVRIGLRGGRSSCFPCDSCNRLPTEKVLQAAFVYWIPVLCNRRSVCEPQIPVILNSSKCRSK